MSKHRKEQYLILGVAFAIVVIGLILSSWFDLPFEFSGIIMGVWSLAIALLLFRGGMWHLRETKDMEPSPIVSHRERTGNSMLLASGFVIVMFLCGICSMVTAR